MQTRGKTAAHLVLVILVIFTVFLYCALSSVLPFYIKPVKLLLATPSLKKAACLLDFSNESSVSMERCTSINI